MENRLNTFQWADLDEEYRNLYWEENIVEQIYLKHKNIDNNHVVLDIGANVGTFSVSVLDKKPKHIYCVEPSKNFFDALQFNMRNTKSTLINAGISSPKDFSNILSENHIEQIDFLKIDCEGCEFDIFNNENHELILDKVRFMAGEYHLSLHKNSVENFLQFRNLYLDNKNCWLYQRDGTHISKYFYHDEWFYRYKEYWDNYNPYLGQIIFYCEIK